MIGDLRVVSQVTHTIYDVYLRSYIPCPNIGPYTSGPGAETTITSTYLFTL